MHSTSSEQVPLKQKARVSSQPRPHAPRPCTFRADAQNAAPQLPWPRLQPRRHHMERRRLRPHAYERCVRCLDALAQLLHAAGRAERQGVRPQALLHGCGGNPRPAPLPPARCCFIGVVVAAACRRRAHGNGNYCHPAPPPMLPPALPLPGLRQPPCPHPPPSCPPPLRLPARLLLCAAGRSSSPPPMLGLRCVRSGVKAAAPSSAAFSMSQSDLPPLSEPQAQATSHCQPRSGT